MKKIILWSVFVLIVVIGIPVGMFMSAFIGNMPIDDGKTFGFATIIKDGFVDVTLLDEGNGKYALIDAGKDVEASAIKKVLAMKGIKSEDIDTILVTHGHGDHISGVPQFPKAKVMILSADKDLAEGAVAPKMLMGKIFGKNKHPIHVDKELVDGEILTLGKLKVEVFSLPGHTGGSAAFLIGDVLVFGDSAGSSDKGKMKASPGVFSESTEQNVASLVKLEKKLESRSISIHHLIFSHSGSLEGFGVFQNFVKGKYIE